MGARLALPVARRRALASDRKLRELVLERAAVDPEHPRGLGDVAVAFAQDALDVLVLQASERWRLEAWRIRGRFRAGIERRENAIGVARLVEVVARAEAHRFHRGGDAPVARQDDHLGVRMKCE